VPAFVIDTVNGYPVEGARRAVVVIVSSEVTGLPVEVKEDGVNPPFAPTGSPEIAKSNVQALLLLLNVRVTSYFAELPGITGFGDWGTTVRVCGFESVNVLNACDFEPTAVKANPTFRS
jgi:hypothetical protein